MFFYFLITIHVFVSLLLMFIVLIQSGKGAELGAAFGGAGQSNQIRGASTFISKFTTGLAIAFMATSLSLAFLTSENSKKSVLDSTQIERTIPATQQNSGDSSFDPKDATSN